MPRVNFIGRNKCRFMAGLEGVEPIYRDCVYNLKPGVHRGVYSGRQILVLQVMVPYLEAWHSWGPWGTWWAQSWALQGTETLWINNHSTSRGAGFIH